MAIFIDKNTNLGAFLILIIIYVSLGIGLNVASAYAGNQTYFPIDSSPFGTKFSDWTAKWWQWLTSFPQSDSPANDETGKNCANGQNSSDVWFLTGAPTGTVERTCSIPSSKSILLAVGSNECSKVEFPQLHIESELRGCAVAGTVANRPLRAVLDGQELVNDSNAQLFEVQSPLFHIVFPQDNLFGQKPGPTEAVSDGYWLFLKPLREGLHELSFSVGGVTNPTTGAVSFANDNTYHLKIYKEKTEP